MILTWNEIKKQIQLNKIEISEFKEEFLTTNSYDLTLWDTLLKYTQNVLNPKINNDFEYIKIPDEWYVIQKWEFLLASTVEKIGSNFYVPIIHNKSWIARLWLFIHITADLIDIWSFWNSTLQLFATLPIRLYAGMKIAQVSFWLPEGEIRLYNGKYMNSEWPQPSKTYIDYL